MHKKLLEAALFMSNKPLGLNELAKITEVNSLGYLKELLESLQKEYSKKGIEIVNTPHGWQMQVKNELLFKVSHLTPYSDLSDGCKRTLALVVYKETMKQSDIIKIQGNKGYSYIRELEKRGLLNTEIRGHTKMLTLTNEFERYFGQEREKVREIIKAEIEKNDGSLDTFKEDDTELTNADEQKIEDTGKEVGNIHEKEEKIEKKETVTKQEKKSKKVQPKKEETKEILKPVKKEVKKKSKEEEKATLKKWMKEKHKPKSEQVAEKKEKPKQPEKRETTRKNRKEPVLEKKTLDEGSIPADEGELVI